MTNALLSVDLTKWPRLLVMGDPVTEAQANEIIIRTTPFYLFTNDRTWLATVCTVLGLEQSRVGAVHWESLRAWRESIAGLDLAYLYNERIMSSWVGGPHGWCDWDGTISCDTYNIGKWPTAAEVDAEWRLIAATWPFLTLRCQLVPNEGETLEPAVEWRISGGDVELVNPGRILTRPRDPQFVSVFVNGERGVSSDRLTQAYHQVRGAQ